MGVILGVGWRGLQKGFWDREFWRREMGDFLRIVEGMQGCGGCRVRGGRRLSFERWVFMAELCGGMW